MKRVSLIRDGFPKTTTMEKNTSKQKMVAIAAVVVVALLAINAFLLFRVWQGEKEHEITKMEKAELEEVKAELDVQYQEALTELEGMRGTNEELNALIEEQKSELTAQKDKIAGLISNGRNLRAARQELATMETQLAGYLAEIENLKAQNEALAGENTGLRNDNTRLEVDLTTERTAKEAVMQEKVVLVSEKELLTDKNAELNKTVNFASVVKVRGVDVTGLKARRSGKLVDTRRAKDVEQLQICFNTSVNDVADAGRERFYVRVMNPVGETLAIEELGSGVLVNNADNQELRYTQMTEVDYANVAENACTSWAPSTPFAAGDYKVQVYNKGYLAGEGNFTLK